MVCLQPEHELQDADELWTLLLRHPQGMFAGQIKDAYKGVLDDVKASLVISAEYTFAATHVLSHAKEAYSLSVTLCLDSRLVNLLHLVAASCYCCLVAQLVCW